MLPVPLLVFVVWGLIYFARHREADSRARFLRNFGFGVMMFMGAFFCAFVVGETRSDPGGFVGVGLVAIWAVPLAVLASFAWRSPDRAAGVFKVLTGAVVLLSLWHLVDRAGWSSFENEHGPVRAIAIFALLLALSFFAWRRPRLGGWLMLSVSVIPVLLSGGGPGFAALLLLNSASVLAAVLFIWSASVEGSRGSPGGVSQRTRVS